MKPTPFISRPLRLRRGVGGVLRHEFALKKPLPYGRGSDKSGRGSDLKRRAFSMAELMVAVVILGIGLLITSSMFPIAWLKARDVAESTNVATAARAAETYVKSLARVNGPRSVHPLERSPSSFFPGDWFAANVAQPENAAAIFPDTRVHLLNTGNYGVGYATMEDDWLDQTGVDQAPIADNGWRLDEGLKDEVLPGVGVYLGDLRMAGVHFEVMRPHVRLIPPLEQIPDSTDPMQQNAFRLWTEQFEARRHLWAVFYRMTEMPGPDPESWLECQNKGSTSPECAIADAETVSALRRPRRMTMYYVTLKRPANGRYARQQGNDANGTQLDITRPRAMPPDDDVLLPSPWRFEASITNATLPANGSVAQTGIPTEIEVDDIVIADMVQNGSYLIDDRNGEVFRVAARKESNNPAQVIFVLDKEYRPGDLYDIAKYDPSAGHGGNYQNLAEFLQGTIITAIETQNERRIYWVFPPPVDNSDTVRAGGVPLFDGSQPVVGVEIRQMMIAPRLGT